MALGLSGSLLGAPKYRDAVVKVGVSKGGGSLEGNSVLHNCVAEDLQVGNVSGALGSPLQPLQSFRLLPSTQPQRCAPELRLRQNSRRTASVSPPP